MPALTRLKHMIEHRLSQDIVRVVNKTKTVYCISFQNGSYYVSKDGFIKLVNINAYAEWFTDSMVDSMLAIGCE